MDQSLEISYDLPDFRSLKSLETYNSVFLFKIDPKKYSMKKDMHIFSCLKETYKHSLWYQHYWKPKYISLSVLYTPTEKSVLLYRDRIILTLPGNNPSRHHKKKGKGNNSHFYFIGNHTWFMIPKKYTVNKKMKFTYWWSRNLRAHFLMSKRHTTATK